MSVTLLLSKAQAMGVRLILNGDGVKLRGPADSIAAMKPELAAHKPEILAHLRRAANDARYPVADGPYMPYVVPMPPERVAMLLADLRTTLDKLADLEGWTDGHLAHMLGLVTRQPISTLADDLAYFEHRLEAVRAADLAAEAIGRVRRASE
ncbi:hypothetical protein LBW60_04875 [Ralstonia solanacearum]|uniref:TubC N-terminal docking domain-related protein n=1 Tax=Ralstonia solanacearum TaxID=305 RepID=UPI002305A4DC|nr:hypothetical protein [Ralstonia solanacearum]MDB0507665.1 hypothetical protein [Ralstonia solanacearum]MDB0512674.1 hypothetical protein [Ralstonia solanacearum]